LFALAGLVGFFADGTSFGVGFNTHNNKEESTMDFLKNLSPHVHWGLRLSLAATFLFHGASKIPVEGPMMGMPVAVIWILALAEVAAGVMLIAGAFGKEILTRLGGLIVVVVMVGAITMVHAKNGFNVMNGGMEFQLLMLVSGLYLAAKGNDA
jgi:putative oxidoreductase